jgi:hypothetical protein
MPPNARVCYIGLIIDLLLAVLENIAVGYLGYRPYTLEQETILQFEVARRRHRDFTVCAQRMCAPISVLLHVHSHAIIQKYQHVRMSPAEVFAEVFAGTVSWPQVWDGANC